MHTVPLLRSLLVAGGSVKNGEVIGGAISFDLLEAIDNNYNGLGSAIVLIAGGGSNYNPDLAGINSIDIGSLMEWSGWSGGSALK